MAGMGVVKRSWAEFRDFAFRGNLIDLAVGFIIGGAFKTVVDSLVNDIIVPAIGYLGKSDPTQGLRIGTLEVGKFIGALLNFLIMALVIFIFVVKIVGALMKKAKPPTEPGQPTTKECPMCLSLIPIKAIKCGHCTSDLPAVA